MSAPNSIHNSDDEDVVDPVTLISKLDVSDPLHLHPNDSTTLTVVSIKLKVIENYQVWSCAMLLALEGKNKIGFIDGSCKRSNTDEVLGRQWDRVNVVVLGWILNSIFEELFIEVLPDVKSAYATISSEESHIVASGSIAGSSQRNQASIFMSNVPNRGVVQRGHSSICFKIIGYPADFGKKKSRQNYKEKMFQIILLGLDLVLVLLMNKCPVDFRKKKSRENYKGKNVSNNVIGSGSSSGFTDEQMATLISLIKDNKNEKNMTAQEKEQRDAILEIKRREVECRERELANEEYRQRQEDIRFYLQ
ncbi:ribonuclease H-like domain-containing protein [Tanacetum coccineum]